MRKKTLWILTMMVLCLVLYMIVVSRMESGASVIFPGSEGTFIRTDGVNFSDLNVTPEPEPTIDIWPKLTTQDFENNTYLQIVNNNNLLSSAYEPEVSKIARTRYMMYSTEYMPELDAFLDAIEAAGFEYFIGGAYRSYSYQAHVYNSKASQIAYELAGGRTIDYTDPLYAEAAEAAKSITAPPGASEHQLGLAIDILDRNRSRIVYSDMNQELYAWLDEHCAEYGFIKRYPTRKLLLTGWDEPWHYRYVGKEVATFVMEQGICYEEFYAHYFPDFEY
ncbi:MAG: M15 family metallopeptidase [Oscillospiraceae bacterium]|nr:M15 family metallopeptidase [Oscillospiraceae bacterium]